MKRRLFNLAAAVSLVLCVATVAVWVRSHWPGAIVQVRYVHSPKSDETHWHHLQARALRGALAFQLNQRHFSPAYFQRQSTQRLEAFRRSYPPGLDWRISHAVQTIYHSRPTLAIRLKHHDDSLASGYPSHTWVFAIHCWLPTALLLVIPSLWVVRFRQATLTKCRGLCPTCGYDLRASPDRCPECGAVAGTEAASIRAR